MNAVSVFRFKSTVNRCDSIIVKHRRYKYTIIMIATISIENFIVIEKESCSRW